MPLADRTLRFALFASAFLALLVSPVAQVTDSTYTLLISQSLLENGSFDIGSYRLGARDGARPADARTLAESDPLPRQLVRFGETVVSAYPPGGAILSTPAVAVAKLLDAAPAAPDGEYDLGREVRLQRIIATLLMAAFAVVAYDTARLLLPTGPALLVSISATFGTQVWSTASRGVWSHTWGILILSIILERIARHEFAATPVRPVWLGALAALLFWVRPTFAIPIATISAFLIVRRVRTGAAFTASAAVGCAAFAAWSLATHGMLVPNYYTGYWMSLSNVREALAGHLVSPSRGLLIFAPATVFVSVLALRYWQRARSRGLLLLAFATIALHVALISASPQWWGGRCYGPRLTADLVPWFVLIAVIAIDAFRRAESERGRRGRALRLAGYTAALLGVLMNAPGALSEASMDWNAGPPNIQQEPRRLWSWSDPQFLAWRSRATR